MVDGELRALFNTIPTIGPRKRNSRNVGLEHGKVDNGWRKGEW